VEPTSLLGRATCCSRPAQPTGCSAFIDTPEADRAIYRGSSRLPDAYLLPSGWGRRRCRRRQRTADPSDSMFETAALYCTSSTSPCCSASPLATTGPADSIDQFQHAGIRLFLRAARPATYPTSTSWNSAADQHEVEVASATGCLRDAAWADGKENTPSGSQLLRPNYFRLPRLSLDILAGCLLNRTVSGFSGVAISVLPL
jgi:hypothetical protein